MATIETKASDPRAGGFTTLRGATSARRHCALPWLLALCMTCAPAIAQAVTEVASLRVTLDRHLAAINARDLDALLATVTQGNALTTILPNGKVLETREQYRELHVDWFKETDWRMLFEVQDVVEHGDVGIARVKYDSQVMDASGRYTSRRVALLSLVFARQNGEWRLVYDQNTVVPPATP